MNLDGCLYPFQQHAVVPGLRDKVESTGSHALNGQVDGAPGRHQNDGNLRAKHLHLLQQRQSFLAIGSASVTGFADFCRASAI